MKILLIGPQGCGKGTIGDMLGEKLGYPVISAGQLLREMPESHPRFIEAKNLILAGKLAPFELLADLIIARTSLDDCKSGYILDGWARSMDNLKFFNPGFQKVIYLTISKETTVERLTNRRTCKHCGAIFNIKTVPPKNPGICDICGGELIQRDDDKEEAILQRLEIFNTETLPVINYFKAQGILIEINAEPAPDIVFNSVLKALIIK